jgi:molecular chaperone GrpE
VGTPAEQSTTQENRDGPVETPADASAEAPENVVPQSNSDIELARLEDRWRRALADLDNLRKRYARELERERQLERSKVAGAWLAVVDNLERALHHSEGDADSVVAGVRAILDQAVQVLDNLGYPRDTETGVPFDPERHEVFNVTDDGGSAPGTVLEVLRPGYGKGAQQLRPAAVVVSGREE